MHAVALGQFGVDEIPMQREMRRGIMHVVTPRPGLSEELGALQTTSCRPDK